MRGWWAAVGCLASGCWQENPHYGGEEASASGVISTSSSSTSGDASSGSAGASSTTGGLCEAAPPASAVVWMVVDEVVDMVSTRSLLRLDAAMRRAVGRYSMNGSGSSRVVTNLFGDAATIGAGDVVVVVAGDPARCPDAGASSTSATDLRPWLADGCVRWSAGGPVGSFMVAWEGLDADGCPAESPGLWVGGRDPDDALAPAVFSRFVDGEQVDAVVVEWPVGIPYLGSVDRFGRLWVTGSMEETPSTAAVIRPDGTFWDVTPPARIYGQTLDASGILWAAGPAGIYRLDTNAAEGSWAWEVAVDRPNFNGWGVTFAEGRLWVGQGNLASDGSCGVVTFEPGSMAEKGQVVECSWPKGVAIDEFGALWVVDVGGLLRAFDADTLAAIVLMEMPPGTIVPQSYSDFTGLALRRALGL